MYKEDMTFSLDHFKQNKAMETELVSMKAERTTLLEQVKAIEAIKAEYEKSQTSLQEWEKEKISIKEDHDKALAAIKAEYEAKIAGLNQNLEATKVSVNKEVVATLSAVGISAGEVKAEPSNNKLSPEAILAHFKSLNGAEKTNYYNTHRNQILQAGSVGMKG